MQENRQEQNFNSDNKLHIETLMDEYSHKLLRYCHTVLCNYHDAQDALQSTFIKAYYKQSSFKKDMDISPWLFKIAYNTCIDMTRKKKIAQILFSSTQKQEEGYIPQNILDALMTLSPLDRALMFSRAIDESSYDELSKIHSKSPEALRKRYERARKKLIEQLKDDYPYYAKKEEVK